MNVSVEFVDGTEKDTELFAIEAIVKFVIGKDLFKKAGEYFRHFFLPNDSFFETNTVEKIDDSDQRVILGRDGFSIGQHLHEQVEYCRWRG